jgi:hypothetical protein
MLLLSSVRLSRAALPVFFAMSALAIGCSTPPDSMFTHHDFAGIDDVDLAGMDLAGVGPDFGEGGTMNNRPWSDKSMAGAAQLWSVWSNGTSTWAVGDNATILKGDLTTPFAADTAMKPSSTAALYGAFGVAGVPQLAGQAGLWTYNGTPAPGNWAAATNTAGFNIASVWTASDGVSFLVGSGLVKKQNGTNWDSLGGIDTQPFSVFGFKDVGSGYTVYACGAASGTISRIWKYTTASGTFAAENTNGSQAALYGIYGFSESDIYAVGDGGTILHSTGTGVWTQQPVAGVTTALNAVGGASPDEVYAVGDNGVVLQKLSATATTWTNEKSALPNPSENRNFLGVWANASQVWVVGVMGAILSR